MSHVNVLYVHSHDTGRCVSPYGYSTPTPTLQKLASQSVLFRNAFSAAPTCSPSRAALLTGQWAHCTGMLGLNHRGFKLSHPGRHLARSLLDHGYDTTLVGVNHVADNPADIGYRRVLATDGDAAAGIGDAAAAFLRARPSEPFFLDVGFVQTHRGRFPPRDPRDDPRHVLPPPGLPDHPVIREDFASFHSAARMLDDGIRRVLQALDESGLADRTLVVCTTDHGISFPRRKCTLFDCGIEVMLMLRGPGTASLPDGFVAGETCDALVSQVDLFPTLCEYLGFDSPGWLQGRSLLPVLRREQAQVRDELFAEVTYHAAYEPQRCVRTNRFKFYRRFDERLRPVLSNLDDGPSKTFLFERGLAELRYPSEALFDLAFDPLEQNNLVDVPAYRAIAADLRSRLEAWMHATSDPLLQGPVPLPEGCFASDPEDYSPKDVLERMKGASPHG